jgi:catalase
MVNFGVIFLTCAGLAAASCPYMENEAPVKRDGAAQSPKSTDEFMAQYEVDDKDVYLTNGFGGPVEDTESLSAGERGPTLLEDFIFREKIMHFGMYMRRQQDFSSNT